MTTTQLRFLAEVNPSTAEFDVLPSDAIVTFMPLGTVWADNRLDTSRAVPKSEVAGGYAKFKSGDVLTPKVTPTFQAGRSAVVGALVNGVGAATTEVHVIRARPDRADPRFLRYRLLAKDFLDEGVANFQGVAGLQRVSADFVSAVRVMPFSLEEQRRIADFLDDQVARIDSITAAREHQVATLDESILAFAHGVVSGAHLGGDTAASGVPWAPQIPAYWGAPRISQVARIGTGHTPSRSEPDYWINCHIPWLTTADVHRFRHDQVDSVSTTELRISKLGLANSAAVLHPAGTVALSRTASAGFSVIMDVDMATSQDYATWTCGSRLVNTYLLWCLRAMRHDLLKRLAMGSTHKTIYFPDLLSIKIPLPPLADQADIVSKVVEHARGVRAALEALRRSVEMLAEYKRSLITAAVSGELDVSTARRGVPV